MQTPNRTDSNSNLTEGTALVGKVCAAQKRITVWVPGVRRAFWLRLGYIPAGKRPCGGFSAVFVLRFQVTQGRRQRGCAGTLVACVDQQHPGLAEQPLRLVQLLGGHRFAAVGVQALDVWITGL